MRCLDPSALALALLSSLVSTASAAPAQSGNLVSPLDPSQLGRASATFPRGVTGITGVVRLADGTPIRGAVVVTDAGGRAVSGPGGFFALELSSLPSSSALSVTALADVEEVSHSGSKPIRTAKLSGGTANNVGVIEVGPVACEASWLSTFGPQPGAEGTVRFLGVLDDGTGPALYAGGDFEGIGGAGSYGVARFDGTRWSPLGEGIGGGSNSEVHALEVADLGAGPQLFAGGRFDFNYPAVARGMAVFDPVTGEWDRFGDNYLQGLGEAYALEEFDDGSGNALYIGGDFQIGGVSSAQDLVRWDGQQWSGIGNFSGSGGYLRALLAHDDGSGPALYAGGSFTNVGAVSVATLARWDGSSWSQVGAGITGVVRALVEFDDGQGDGAVLFAAGNIQLAGDTVWRAVVRWDGTSWSALEAGTIVPPYYNGANALSTATVDGTPVLVVGGNFPQVDGQAADRVACWDGTAWSPLPVADPAPGAGYSRPVNAVASFAPPGEDEELFVGGEFFLRDGDPGDRILRRSDAGWETLADGLNDDVFATAVFDDGSGPRLYVGGVFSTAGGQPAGRVASWDGTAWSSLGEFGDSSSSAGTVYALEVFDDGSGPALYAGGSFTNVDGLPAHRLVRWDGSTWSAVGGGVTLVVRDLLAVDASSPLGPALYLCGSSGTGGGTSVGANVARWNGLGFSPLGSGLGFPFGPNSVHALALFDDGGGEDLYAGGSFETPGASLAKWNGSVWSGVGDVTVVTGFPGGISAGTVRALAVHDDGNGPALFIGGGFDTVGGVAADDVARFDGASWSALPGAPLIDPADTLAGVTSLRVHDDGTGRALYVGGGFGFGEGAPSAIRGIGRLTDTGWVQVAGGTDGSVHHLGAYRPPGAPRASLVVGGGFASADDSGDSYLAQWGCAP